MSAIASRPRRNDRPFPDVDLDNLTIEPPPNPLRRPFADTFDIEQEEFDDMPDDAKAIFTRRHKFQHMWGYLESQTTKHAHVQFSRPLREIVIGRKPDPEDKSLICVPAEYISKRHCTFEFSGWSKEHRRNLVTLTPHSEAGIYVNKEKIAKGKSVQLIDGSTITFMSEAQMIAFKGLTDADKFHFIYRDCPPAVEFHKTDWFYDVQRRLGEGGFGLVHLAEHRVTNQVFAIKHIAMKDQDGTMQDHIGALEMALREITTFQAFSHPNIALMYEWYVEGDASVDLVLEYISGGDFKNYVLKQWSHGIQESMMKHIAFQVCEALAFLHAGGLAHRDIKPQNILVTDQPWPVVKITDFGISKISSSGMYDTQCGTPGFQAPEVQKAVIGLYGVNVDSWSVAFTCYYAYTGGKELPFTKAELDALAHTTEPVGPRLQKLTSMNKVSVPGMALLHNLTHLNPLHRISITQALTDPWFAAPFVPRRDGHDDWYEREKKRQTRVKSRKQREQIRFYHLPDRVEPTPAPAPVPGQHGNAPMPVIAARGPSIAVGGGHGSGRFAAPMDTWSDIDGEPMDMDEDEPVTIVPTRRPASPAKPRSSPKKAAASPKKPSSSPKKASSPKKKSLPKPSGSKVVEPAAIASPRKAKSTVARLVAGIPGAFPDTLELGGPTSPPAKMMTRAQAAKSADAQGQGSTTMRVLRGVKKIVDGANV